MLATTSGVLVRQQRPQARMRLLCLPYAGASSTAYRGWEERLPPWVELAAIQLPGRGARFRERTHLDFDTLLPGLMDDLAPYLDGTPFAVFGHSMGALIGFELCRALRRHGWSQPRGLIVSGRRAPHLPQGTVDVAGLSRNTVVEMLREYGGTPKEVIDDPELLDLFLPALRADFTLINSYRYTAQPPFEFPVVAYTGSHDSHASVAEVAEWREHTTKDCPVRIFGGGHFFLNDSPSTIRRLSRDLAGMATQEGPQR